MKKMHGLNVAQAAYYSDPIRQTLNLAQSQLANTRTFAVGTPFWLNGMLFSQDISPDDDIYVKRAYRKIYLTNVGNMPNFYEVTWLRVRKDITSSKSFNSILTDGAPLPNYPFVSPFTSKELQSVFKITKSKTRLVQPMKMIKFTLQQYFGTRKLIGSTDRDESWTARRGNVYCYVRIWGVPLTSGLASPNGTILSGVESTCVGKDYLSYYKMNDVDPDSVVLSTLPQSVTVVPSKDMNSTVVGVEPLVNTSIVTVDQVP